MTSLKAPFPYFGGKSRVAKHVWSALGQPKHYIEPFFGSGAVLLLRPDYDASAHTETVCDKDGFVANVWRSIKYSPEETANWCDWPVNHADLIARRKVLLANEERLLQNLCADDMWHDPKLAGYWIWAAGCWIGTTGLTSPNARPHISNAGNGVHVKTKQVNEWLAELSLRLRSVRVVCGDWNRVCGGNWQDSIGVCGMFFDPPYSDTDRDDCYHHEDYNVAKDVEVWCLDRGANPRYRIVCAGYDTEYKKLVAAGWRAMPWKSSGGYSKTSKAETRGKVNRGREMLFFSPHCLQDAGGLYEQSE